MPRSDCACRYGRTTVATVDIPLGDGTAQRVVTEIAVRDLLIAGLGDSIAAGEGDPDQAVQLEGGFCFRRFGRRPILPAGPRRLYRRPILRERTGERPTAAKDWARHGARWMSPACHRSLYSYQAAHRARARNRAAAPCRDVPAARLHRRLDPGRHVRRAELRRLPGGRRHRQLARGPRRRSSPN